MLHSYSPTNCLSSYLTRWAQHLASSEAAQRRLVERTIAAASDDPTELLNDEQIEQALLGFMLEIARSDVIGDRQTHGSHGSKTLSGELAPRPVRA